MRLTKENEEFMRKEEEAKRGKANLLSKLKEFWEENATLKKDANLSDKKWKFCENELEILEKEVDEVTKATVELEKNVELRVHNSMEEHITNFLQSSTFDNIVNLYQLPTTILAFTDYWKKVKTQHPELDVMSFTFGDQEGSVEENGDSKTTEKAHVVI